MSDEPIPSLAEALTEIRRLRDLVRELEAASDAWQARVMQLDGQMRRNAEIWLVETDRGLARIAELEAAAAMIHGTLERATTLGPVIITHNVSPSAPPHDE